MFGNTTTLANARKDPVFQHQMVTTVGLAPTFTAGFSHQGSRMTAQYFVNMENAQLYFDAQMQRCKPPGNGPDAKLQTMYFVRVEEGGALLKNTWDIGLAEFTESQRERGRLYEKTEA